MPQLRQPGCSCPGAASGSVTRSGSGDTYFEEQFNLNGGAPLAASATLIISWDFFIRKDQLSAGWNGASGGASLYDTGCVAGSGSTSVTVPAGAITVGVGIIPSCDPSQTTPPTEWTFTLSWEENGC